MAYSVCALAGSVDRLRAMAANLSSVAVYCGSNSGTDPAYAQAAAALGRIMAGRGIHLRLRRRRRRADGHGRPGAVLEYGGEAHGVITEALVAKEIAHGGP